MASRRERSFPIAMEGRLLKPGRALDLGLVDEVVPAAELDARAVGAGRAPWEAFRPTASRK